MLVMSGSLSRARMSTLPSYLPAAERRAATVDSVVALAATTNPSEITTAAIATRMGLSQGALFSASRPRTRSCSPSWSGSRRT